MSIDLWSAGATASQLDAAAPTPRRDCGGNHSGFCDRRRTRCDGFCNHRRLRDGVADDAYASDTCWSEWHFSLLSR